MQLMDGFTDIEFLLYVERSLFFNFIPLVYIGVLAFLFQVLAKNRYVGMMFFAVFMLLIVGSHDLFGIEHPLASYVFPDIGAPLSDMNGNGRFMAFGYWMRSYWGAIAGLLLVLIFIFWPRGIIQPNMVKLRRLSRMLSAGQRRWCAAMLLTLVGTGSYIYYNTNILNDYLNSAEVELLLVNYEKQYRQYEHLPIPRIVAIDNRVDIYPNDLRVIIESEHILQNKTNEVINSVHVGFPPGLDISRVVLQHASSFEKEDDVFNYYRFNLDKPMNPGEQYLLKYQAKIEASGFSAGSPDVSLVANGTFLLNNQITPTIGFNPDYIIKDNRKRKAHGLAPIARRPKLEDSSQLDNNVHRQDSDFVQLNSVISTINDQNVVGPGKLINTWRQKGRRYFHFQVQTPTRNFYSYQSARYNVAKSQWQDVDIEVHHHHAHDYNVDRMISGVQDSLEYFSREFSPYQFKQLRIAEFPAYRHFAQSLPSTIPYSESIGFVANVGEDDIDMPYYVTAHEVAHQWWGFQVVAANTQGDGFIHESLAQYFALLVMEKKYGKHKIRQYLKYELDKYLSGRAGDANGELPLYRVERQPYIYYRKGAVIMYMLRDYLGEEVVNRSLRRLLKLRGFSSTPYTQSTDFIKILREEAGAKFDSLITDSFEKITLYDLKLTAVQISKLEDERFKIIVEVDVGKHYAESDGSAVHVDLDLPIDIGLFTQNPDKVSFSNDDVIYLKKQTITGNKANIELIVNKKPVYVGIDPYHKLIDRNTEDNLLKIK